MFKKPTVDGGYPRGFPGIFGDMLKKSGRIVRDVDRKPRKVNTTVETQYDISRRENVMAVRSSLEGSTSLSMATIHVDQHLPLSVQAELAEVLASYTSREASRRDT